MTKVESILALTGPATLLPITHGQKKPIHDNYRPKRKTIKTGNANQRHPDASANLDVDSC